MLILPPPTFQLSKNLQSPPSKTLGIKPSAMRRTASYARNLTELSTQVRAATSLVNAYLRATKKPTRADLDVAVARLNDYKRLERSILDRVQSNMANLSVFRKNTTSHYTKTSSTGWIFEVNYLKKQIKQFEASMMKLAERVARNAVQTRNAPRAPRR